MKAKTIKSGISCSCGCPLMIDEIPIGTEYTIDKNDVERLVMSCGYCKNKHQ